jgi:Tol biopolymer transport system component
MALAVLGCGDPTDPDDDPIAIVFAYAPVNNVAQADLYVMSENGRVRRPLLVREGSDESQPVWSPDGTGVVFMSFPISGTPQIYVVREDGSGLTQLTDGAITVSNWGPVWSPDGSRIAFVRIGNPTATLAIVNSDGTGLALVPGTEAVHLFARPSWSPDGTRLAFSRRTGATYDIWAIAPDGSGLTKLSSGVCGDFYPAWSPDGTKLAFAAVSAVRDDDRANPPRMQHRYARWHPHRRRGWLE